MDVRLGACNAAIWLGFFKPLILLGRQKAELFLDLNPVISWLD